MFYWSKSKDVTDLEKLQKRYCRLMKNAYNLAIKDKVKSDLLHEEATKVLTQIRDLEHQA